MPESHRALKIVGPPHGHLPPGNPPTVGEMMERLASGDFDGMAHDKAYPERMKQAIY